LAQNENGGEQLKKRIFFVSLFEFLNVVVQFANYILWGFIFGARAEMDAFLTSVALPTVLVAVTTGPLISSLVPLLVEAKGKKNTAELTQYKNNLLNLFGAGGILLALLLFAASGLIMHLIAPGLNTQLSALAAGLLRIEAISIPLSIGCGVLISFYYAEEKFYRSTIASFFGGLAAILVILCWHKNLGIHTLAWGIVANTMVQLLFMLGIARHHSWRLNWKDEGVRKLARKMLPLSGGNIYYKSDSLVDRFILSFLPAGSISYLGYGQRVVGVIGQILSRGLVTTRFTELSAKSVNDRSAFKESLNRLLVQASFIIAPIAACLALFIRPFLHYVLERGAFSSLDVQRTAAVIVAFLGLLVGGLLGSVLANAFYALGDTKTITLIGMSTFTLGILLKISGVFLFSYVGVALATSTYFMLSVVVEMVVLQRKIKVFSWQETGIPVSKIVVSASLAFAMGLLYKKILPSDLLSLLGGLVFAGAMYILFSVSFGVVHKDDLPIFFRKRLHEKKSEI
jgi:putative peptidoglycan lipid II flippase